MSTNLEVGIVGLPNVGKSTLFNAITKAGVEAANYPFATIEPNVGVVEIPDTRLNILAEIYKPKRILPATMRFVDIAGIVEGASKGAGLGNKFLSHIREVDAIIQVVRCFEDSNITHVAASVDPLRDIEIINTELCLADLETVEKRLQRIKKIAQSGDKNAREDVKILEKLIKTLGDSKPIKTLALAPEELPLINELNLLTNKPILFVANVAEDEVNDEDKNSHLKNLKAYAKENNIDVIAISAKIEAEIAELPPEEAQLFLEELELTESGLNRLIKASYALLGLINYFTAGVQELRAWTIINGTKAPQAAGKIHTDFEKGFIRAEIVSYNDLVSVGSQSVAKEKGLVRLEGKEYVMHDGDITHFLFNV